MKRLVVFTFFLTVFSLTGLPGPVNLFKTETAEAATKAQWRHAKRSCRKKYGRRLLRTTITKKGKILCNYRTNTHRSQASLAKSCRKKYGRRFIKTTIHKGKPGCLFRTRTSKNRNGTYADVIKYCRKHYKGNLVINARKKFGKWYCTWRE